MSEYQANFYGTDYSTAPGQGTQIGLDSDRLFAEWDLSGDKTIMLAMGETFEETREPAREIEIPNDWNALGERGPARRDRHPDTHKAGIRKRFRRRVGRTRLPP